MKFKETLKSNNFIDWENLLLPKEFTLLFVSKVWKNEVALGNVTSLPFLILTSPH